MIDWNDVKANVDRMGNPELVKRFEALQGFLLKGKQQVEKGKDWIGLDVKKSNDLNKVMIIMRERQEVIDYYRNEIIKRMQETEEGSNKVSDRKTKPSKRTTS